ncbi:transcription factor bHLH51-like [Abrus precatorius]|uniref:Transcription factor bHLH51-like n=1 Tax=Abrus precatorius TaxID=3816 RepID=A0A8B8JNQ1_ABRPR|nr:transcription factor bHLH51-like [Abrus precatorius]
MVSIVLMENYYFAGWPMATNHVAQCNSAPNSDQSPFSVPTKILPLASDPASLQFGEFPSWPTPIEGAAEDRPASASKSHSQAEKRRRDRINAQLATLRKLIPKSDKMDKAALLGSVVDHVKDLKRKAEDVSKAITVPTEIDEVTIDYHPAQDESYTTVNILKENIVIKASVCCDDRPELFPELVQVLKGLRLTAVKADIASVGGRIKSILVLCSKDREEGSVCLSTLKQSLKSAVNKIASLSVATNCPTRSKRQRFFLPSHYVQ